MAQFFYDSTAPLQEGHDMFLDMTMDKAIICSHFSPQDFWQVNFTPSLAHSLISPKFIDNILLNRFALLPGIYLRITRQSDSNNRRTIHGDNRPRR